MNYIIVFITIISIVFFFILVKALDFVPKIYYDNIALMEGISISIIIASTIIGLYAESLFDKEQKKKEYVDNIIVGFEKIDDFLMSNGSKYKIIIKILYHKVQLPSSDTDIGKLFDTLTPKEKDILFIIYNKITYNLEKIFLVDPKLFDNKNLGMRIRLYIDSIYYYEFWNNTQNLYNTQFVDFMNHTYVFLNFENSIYNKPNRNLNRNSEGSNYDFIYNSPKYSSSWLIKN
jgi:hypothetical protein